MKSSKNLRFFLIFLILIIILISFIIWPTFIFRISDSLSTTLFVSRGRYPSFSQAESWMTSKRGLFFFNFLLFVPIWYLIWSFLWSDRQVFACCSFLLSKRFLAQSIRCVCTTLRNLASCWSMRFVQGVFNLSSRNYLMMCHLLSIY